MTKEYFPHNIFTQALGYDVPTIEAADDSVEIRKFKQLVKKANYYQALILACEVCKIEDVSFLEIIEQLLYALRSDTNYYNLDSRSYQFSAVPLNKMKELLAKNTNVSLWHLLASYGIISLPKDYSNIFDTYYSVANELSKGVDKTFNVLFAWYHDKILPTLKLSNADGRQDKNYVLFIKQAFIFLHDYFDFSEGVPKKYKLDEIVEIKDKSDKKMDVAEAKRIIGSIIQYSQFSYCGNVIVMIMRILHALSPAFKTNHGFLDVDFIFPVEKIILNALPTDDFDEAEAEINPSYLPPSVKRQLCDRKILSQGAIHHFIRYDLSKFVKFFKKIDDGASLPQMQAFNCFSTKIKRDEVIRRLLGMTEGLSSESSFLQKERFLQRLISLKQVLITPKEEQWELFFPAEFLEAVDAIADISANPLTHGLIEAHELLDSEMMAQIVGEIDAMLPSLRITMNSLYSTPRAYYESTESLARIYKKSTVAPEDSLVKLKSLTKFKNLLLEKSRGFAAFVKSPRQLIDESCKKILNCLACFKVQLPEGKPQSWERSLNEKKTQDNLYRTLLKHEELIEPFLYHLSSILYWLLPGLPYSSELKKLSANELMYMLNTNDKEYQQIVSVISRAIFVTCFQSFSDNELQYLGRAVKGAMPVLSRKKGGFFDEAVVAPIPAAASNLTLDRK